MGTRALIHVKGDVWAEDDTPETTCTIYHHWDGYPSYLGDKIKEVLSGRLVNGIPAGMDRSQVYNGMGQAAAALIAGLGWDNVELREPDTCEVGEEYVYTLSSDSPRGDGKLQLEIRSGPMTAFGMGGQPVKQMPVIYDGLLADMDGAAVERAENEEPEEATG